METATSLDFNTSEFSARSGASLTPIWAIRACLVARLVVKSSMNSLHGEVASDHVQHGTLQLILGDPWPVKG